MDKLVKVTTENYKCPTCGSIYGNEENAQECLDFSKLIKTIMDKWEPYKWYKIQRVSLYTKKVKEEWFFIRKMHLSSRLCGEPQRCTDWSLKLVQADEYMGFGEHCFLIMEQYGNYKVNVDLNFESIKEHYEKYGVIPGPFTEETLSRLPKEVVQDINECIEDKRKKCIQEIESLSKEELVKRLLSHENEYFTKYIIYKGQTDKGFEDESQSLAGWEALCRSLGGPVDENFKKSVESFMGKYEQ